MYGPGMYPGGAMAGVYAYSPTPGQQGPAGSSRPGREPQPSTYTEGKVFIGGMDPRISSEDVTQHCSQWGEVVDAVAIKDRGYGFATFADPASAQRFLEAKEHTIKGVQLDVKAAMPKSMGGAARRTRKLFVGGTGELTDADLRDHFAAFGVIEDCAVITRDNKSRGFGFVTFQDEVSVEKCLVQHHIINGRKVEPKRAVPKDILANMQAEGGPGGAGGAIGGPGGAVMYPQMGPGGGYGGSGGYPPPHMRHMGHMDPYMMMHMGGYPAMWGYPSAAAAAAAAAAAYQYPGGAPGIQMGHMGWQQGGVAEGGRAGGTSRAPRVSAGDPSPGAAGSSGSGGGNGGGGRAVGGRAIQVRAPTATNTNTSSSSRPRGGNGNGGGGGSNVAAYPTSKTTTRSSSPAIEAPANPTGAQALAEQLAGTSLGPPGLQTGTSSTPGVTQVPKVAAPAGVHAEQDVLAGPSDQQR